MFHDKTLLITGGTGTFGNAVLCRFLQTDIGEIRIFSRAAYCFIRPQLRQHGAAHISLL